RRRCTRHLLLPAHRHRLSDRSEAARPVRGAAPARALPHLVQRHDRPRSAAGGGADRRSGALRAGRTADAGACDAGRLMGAFGLFAPLAWRNLWRNPRRTWITLAVVAVGVWSILAFDVVLKAWVESSRQEALRLLTGEGQIHAAGYLDDPGVAHRMPTPSGPLRAALNGPQVSGWAPRVRVSAIIQSEYRTRAVTLVGVSPAAERKVSDLPGQMLSGRYLRGPDEAGLVIGKDLAEKLKTRLGKRVIVMAQAADGHLAEVGLPIVGLFGNTRPAQDEFVFTGLATAQSTLGAGTDLSEISFDARPGATLNSVVAALKRAAPGLDVQSWETLQPLAFTM